MSHREGVTAGDFYNGESDYKKGGLSKTWLSVSTNQWFVQPEKLPAVEPPIAQMPFMEFSATMLAAYLPRQYYCVPKQ